jgi:hypothetical protein
MGRIRLLIGIYEKQQLYGSYCGKLGKRISADVYLYPNGLMYDSALVN